MIKKISVAQLKPGMFVKDMDCGWMEHPFLTDSFTVRSDKDIEKMIANGIHELYIDSEKGLDVVDAPTSIEVEETITRKIIEVANKFKEVEAVSLHDELPNARRVRDEANQVIGELMMGVRQGKKVETERLDPVVNRMSESILRNKDALVSLCRIKEKDNYTFLHSVSVGALLMCFTRVFRPKPDDMELVGIGGMLHDIGKTMVPDRILNKPGALTPEEFVTIQMHVQHGQNILSGARSISQTSFDVVAQHHERYDGTGYPLKLKGAEMSVYGQMASIVDVYDAMTSNRVYRVGMDPTLAVKKMFEWSRSHFDPELIQIFVRSIGIYPVGSLVMLESKRLAIILNQDGRDLTRPAVRAIYDANKRCFIAPQDIDLSANLGRGGGDRITSPESSTKWGIDAHQFL
ncbi:MAG: phosphodiesterase [Comamonadaceae bacterium CG_4_9_14_3_um_filter_60_33]|nr:MAG: phosphodiesterase [Comamonadaceae bacterium CG2_30_59_20]PIY28676.1 MAG: phosphodiesterase [Comamonadaceae bacterium CG_4_10_14_3_um_filter_60_42]PJB40686.1 MAG: phosphodiesterase [Comamonadaceae bacterium CG_4_9_14_3_um_filter_60_33]